MNRIKTLGPTGAVRLALGGNAAIAAALGIGRFVYTPILPGMMDALDWSNVDGGLVASANYLGYFLGALAAVHAHFAKAPRRWLVIGLATSALTTVAMALASNFAISIMMRFAGGVASAFVLICSSALVIERLAQSGNERLTWIHFAGMGAGVVISATLVELLHAAGASWDHLWLAVGLVAAALALLAANWIEPEADGRKLPAAHAGPRLSAPIIAMIVSYGLFGFGYVITATFLIAIVRRTPELASIEPAAWVLFGLAAIPSVPLWQSLARRIGLIMAYAAACLVQAVGVMACVTWVNGVGVALTAVLLGNTVIGITALGLLSVRTLAEGRPQRMIGLMTASFGVGQMIGPFLGGVLYDYSGSFRLPSIVAASALVIATLLGVAASRWQAGDSGAARAP